MNEIIIAVLIFTTISQLVIISASLFEDYFNSSFYKIFLSACSITILISVLVLISRPQAMDVYKGTTTLEITYKDKVPIDSTVVWKNDK